MDWNTILETSAAVIVSFGGAGAIIAGVTKFAADKIADKLEKKYELKLSKELESFKSKLENRSYVSKTRFDAEFGIYHQLSVTAVSCFLVSLGMPAMITRHTKDDMIRRLKKQSCFRTPLQLMPLLYQKKCICYFVIWKKKANGS